MLRGVPVAMNPKMTASCYVHCIGLRNAHQISMAQSWLCLGVMGSWSRVPYLAPCPSPLALCSVAQPPQIMQLCFAILFSMRVPSWSLLTLSWDLHKPIKPLLL